MTRFIFSRALWLSIPAAIAACANGQSYLPEDAGDATFGSGGLFSDSPADGANDGAIDGSGGAGGAGAADGSGGGAADGTGPEADWSVNIGYGCAIQSDCTGFHHIPQGKCETIGLNMACTKVCTAHADCGCDVGTTDDTITGGLCSAACVNGFCKKVCQGTIDCVAGTCKAQATYMVCK